MINKCLYWQLTMTCYDDILCAMLKMAWMTLRCTEHFGSACLTAQGDRKTLPDGPFPFLSSDAGGCVSCGWPDSSVCSEHWAPRLATRSGWTSHRVLNWNFSHAALADNRHGPAQTVWPGVVWELCTSSQTTCLYYIVLTKSLCLAHTPLFLYSVGETLLVYVFDICTNAPLWKRKWNLDISVIISLPAFSFTAN